MNGFRLPDNSQRMVSIGRTGSGKTTLSLWALSYAPFNNQPYVMINYKRDQALDSIDRAEEITLNEIPKHPGLYHIHPAPITDDDAVENWLRNVHAKGNIGLYMDEAYPVPSKGGAAAAILMQGRSLRIPVIANTQRPVEVSRFFFSEADHVALFHLNDRRDQKIVQEFMPPKSVEERLPSFHSLWYDVGHNSLHRLRPVPPAPDLIDKINDRLKPVRKVY